MRTAAIEYSPLEPFAKPAKPGQRPPRVFGAPSRYVQGAGVVDDAGHYLSRLGFRRSAVLASPRSFGAEADRVVASMGRAGLSVEPLSFGGECSLQAIEGHARTLQCAAKPVDGVVAVGGGKVVDAGRALAHRLGVPVAVIPSLASNDAPCAAVSVIYTPEGATADAEIYDENPVLVLVDTAIIAAADRRYLVAGRGDAMATWYEARATAATPGGVSVFGGRPTLAATALAQLCAATLYRDGADALDALGRAEISDALENVVEANTLLSGLGYESGGIAAAHAVAQGFTLIERVHNNCLHGEMVAMGVLAQLLLEGDLAEAEKAAGFFAAVGLPVRLANIGIDPDNGQELGVVVAGAMAFPFLCNMPDPVTPERLLAAILAADELGARIV